MQKANETIRNRAKEKSVMLWELAGRFGTSDANFSRKLRYEFSAEDKEKALSYIDEIAAEHKGRG